MAVQLPDDLIVEILSILPAKSLLRCQLVCKSWLSLINSTKFKLMHLRNFNQLNPRYFICQYNRKEESYNVHLDDEALTIDGGTLVEFPSNHSLIIENCRTSGLCCNGVLCLSTDGDYEESSFDEIILWNPSIRRKLTLTVPSFYPIDFDASLFILGFGYDKMSDDYKVVCLAFINSMKTQAEVYSLKTGIWREVMFPDDLSCFIIHPEWSQVSFNGSVHWIARHRWVSHTSIMTFDTSSEIFGQILLPDDLVKVYPDEMMISVLGESLAVTYYKCQWRGSMASSSYKIWVMKEYKNPASWIMIYNMHYPDIDMGSPMQLRNKADTNMIIHDRIASDIYVGCRYCVERYQESLVLLDVGDIVPNEEAMKALMMIEKQESGQRPYVAA